VGPDVAFNISHFKDHVNSQALGGTKHPTFSTNHLADTNKTYT